MYYEYPISKFDLPKFLKHLDSQFTCEERENYGCNLIMVDETNCTNIEHLRSQQDKRIVGIIEEVYSQGFLFNEYCDFCAIEEGDDEFVMETRGKKEYEKILKMAEERGWKYDEGCRTAATGMDIYFAVLVALSDDKIIIEPGYIGEDPSTGLTAFGPDFTGMPEVEAMIKDLADSCIR